MECLASIKVWVLKTQYKLMECLASIKVWVLKTQYKLMECLASIKVWVLKTQYKLMECLASIKVPTDLYLTYCKRCNSIERLNISNKFKIHSNTGPISIVKLSKPPSRARLREKVDWVSAKIDWFPNYSDMKFYPTPTNHWKVFLS